MEQHQKFIWPPRPLPDEREVLASLRAGSDASDPASVPKSRMETLLKRCGEFLGAMERDWLGLVESPLAMRMAESGWSPDRPEEYCDRCGASVGYGEGTEFGCASCAGTRPKWERVIRLGLYAPPLDDWIQGVKFRRCHFLGEQIGKQLGKALRQAGVLDRAGGATGLVVTPVPTTFRRRLERKIDHTLALARGVGNELGVSVRQLLVRQHRRSQRSVAFSEREANVRGAIRLRGSAVRRVRGRRVVVLVDDVTTSGATLRACTRALRAWPGIEAVWCGVVGVAPDHARREGNTGRGDVDDLRENQHV